MCYVPLGDPLARGDRMLDAYADADVDVLEVGIPTADPWLDGREVTESMARARAQGVDAGVIGRQLGAWREARERAGRALPAILWFGYPNVSLDAIRMAAQTRAMDALLMIKPHAHPEAALLDDMLTRLGVARCAFLPWDPQARDLHAARGATGYVMVQARPGVTGAQAPPDDPAPLVRIARDAAPERPVVAGFGIASPTDVRRVLRAGVDGVVSGSACVRALRVDGLPGLRAHLDALVAATRPRSAA